MRANERQQNKKIVTLDIKILIKMQACILLVFVCNWANRILATCLMTGQKKDSRGSRTAFIISAKLEQSPVYYSLVF